MMAHLVFLTSTPPSVAHGSGTWVGISVLRDALMSMGHEVTLVTRSPDSSKDATFSRVLFNLCARKRLRSITPDAVIGFDLDGVFARRGCIHVAAIKGVLADEARYERGVSRRALALQAHLEARNIRRADRIITTSCYSRQRIVRFYRANPERISIVPEPIDLARWERSLQDAAVVDDGPLRVLCVAHLYPRKGVDTLIRAFARLREDVVLRIVGIGPEKCRLQYLAARLGIVERVRFLGLLSFQDLLSEYRNASVFALPSAQEGFGIVFLEAMASSLPVVAARAAAVPEVVEDGVTAVLVDPDDDAAVAEKLSALIDDRTLRQTMGAAGNARVRNYDAPFVASKFLEAVGIR